MYFVTFCYFATFHDELCRVGPLTQGGAGPLLDEDLFHGQELCDFEPVSEADVRT